jgi:hypothetical protein
LAVEVDERILAGTPAPEPPRWTVHRATVLAALATRAALDEAGWPANRDAIGLYLGVGAAGVELGEVDRWREGGAMPAQVTNDLPLSFTAAREGLGGPGGAFLSRGSGTVFALLEAIHALEGGAGESASPGGCEKILAGGADSTVVPLPWDELAILPMRPAEGAAVLALATGPGKRLATLQHAAVAAGPIDRWRVRVVHDVDTVIVAESIMVLQRELVDFATRLHPGARIHDLGEVLGAPLAATPALGWAAALDLIASGNAWRVRILSCGLEGDAGDVVLTGAET